jgi:hypothetical protein
LVVRNRYDVGNRGRVLPVDSGDRNDRYFVQTAGMDRLYHGMYVNRNRNLLDPDVVFSIDENPRKDGFRQIQFLQLRFQNVGQTG